MELKSYRNLLEYFLKSYKLANDERHKPSTAKNMARIELLDQIIALLVSYSGIYLQFPSMFPYKPDLGFKHFIAVLEADSTSELYIPKDFLSKFVERFKTDGLAEIFGPIFEELNTRVLQSHILGSYNAPLRALILLLNQKPLANTFLNLDKWIPKKRNTSKEMEVQSLIGPFLRISALPADILSTDPLNFFVEPVTPQNERNYLDEIRTQSKLVQKRIGDIFVTLLKCNGRDSRDRVLDWVASVLNRNRDRLKMNIDTITICSSGFMVNLTAVLLQLSEPFIDTRFSKIGSIDPEYFAKYSRVEIADDQTRVKMDLATFKKYKEEVAKTMSTLDPKSADPNFISECFFSTLQAFHLEVVPLFLKYDRIQRNSLDNQKKTCYKAQLLDPDFLDLCFRFFNFTTVWLVRTAVGGTSN